ncbi:hypothetical protein BDC45DRAFT_504881 [Circinella umbellata]|nr:hypothetical protein BDC45DRAFT_504881 [Circinella umbellata]
MHRLSLAALLVLSLSVSTSRGAPTLSGGSLDMINEKSNIYHEAGFHQGQHRIHSANRGHYKDNEFQQQGRFTPDGSSGAFSFFSKRQQVTSEQPDISQEHEKDGDNNGDGNDEDDDVDGGGGDNDDNDNNVNQNQVVDPAPINDNDKVLAQENDLGSTPTPSLLTLTTKPPINTIPSPTPIATTTTPEKNTRTPTKNTEKSQPLVETVEGGEGNEDDTKESQSISGNKAVKPESTPHEYHDGLTVTLEDKDNFCLMLPKSPGDQNIGESEKSARAFCTKEGLTPGAQMMPEGLIKDAEFKTGSSYVEVTGVLNIAAYQLSSEDGGGQYDDHGAGSPPNSHCINYPYYVSLIEPDQNRFCIRCCHSYKNCNAGRSEYGCQAILRDE